MQLVLLDRITELINWKIFKDLVKSTTESAHIKLMNNTTTITKYYHIKEMLAR